MLGHNNDSYMNQKWNAFDILCKQKAGLKSSKKLYVKHYDHSQRIIYDFSKHNVYTKGIVVVILKREINLSIGIIKICD
jgi:hypothetical protein